MNNAERAQVFAMGLMYGRKKRSTMTKGPGGMTISNPWSTMTMGPGGMSFHPSSPTAQVSPAGPGAIINNGKNTGQMGHVQAPYPTGVIGISNPMTTMTMGPGGMNIRNPWTTMTKGPGGMTISNPWTTMTMGPGSMNIQPPSPIAQVSPAGPGAIVNNGHV